MNVIANHIGKNTQSDIQADGTLYDGAEKAFRGTIDLKRGCAGSRVRKKKTCSCWEMTLSIRPFR